MNRDDYFNPNVVDDERVFVEQRTMYEQDIIASLKDPLDFGDDDIVSDEDFLPFPEISDENDVFGVHMSSDMPSKTHLQDGIESGIFVCDLSEMKDYFEYVKDNIDVHSAYDLDIFADNAIRFSNLNFRKCDNQECKDYTFYKIAEIIETVKMKENESDFRKEAEQCDVGAGELLARRIRHTKSVILCDGMHSGVDYIYDLAEKYSKENGYADEHESFRNDRITQEFKEDYKNTQQKQDREVMKNLIYENEGIERDTPADKVPAYILEMLEEAGIPTDEDENVDDFGDLGD